MSQDMGDKIRQISEMLNSPEAQEGIRHLFGSLGTNRARCQQKQIPGFPKQKRKRRNQAACRNQYRKQIGLTIYKACLVR